MHIHAPQCPGYIQDGYRTILVTLTAFLLCLWSHQGQAGTTVDLSGMTRPTLNDALDMVSIDSYFRKNCSNTHIFEDNSFCETENSLTMDIVTLKYLTKPASYVKTQVLDHPGVALPSGYGIFSDSNRNAWPAELHK